MKVVNFTGLRYDSMVCSWPSMYLNLFKSFHTLGYTIRISPNIKTLDKDNNYVEVFKNRKLGDIILPDYVKVGIIDDPNHIYIFNHTHTHQVEEENWPSGKINLFIKPSGPGSKHFTIDPIGYSSHTSISYDKPNFENVKYEKFYKNEISNWIKNKINKWDDDSSVNEFIKPIVNIPNNHILFIGQIPGDETCTVFSFGDHWLKLRTLINALITDEPVVIKLHPYLSEPVSQLWAEHYHLNDQIKEWEDKGYTVLSGFESMHEILPKTKVAILENSTAGLECLMHNTPIISYGYPEYHWVTKDLRHALNINKYIRDLSWYDEHKAKSWLAWWHKNYICFDYTTTLNRIKKLL